MVPTSDLSKSALKYLTDRGVSEKSIQSLNIHWVDRETATTAKYGFGRGSVSPDGVIVFPISQDGEIVVAVARNFYASDESRAAHLAAINRDRRSKGLAPVTQVPKYIVPVGDRAKGKLYDPYSILNPGTDKDVLFATEDLIGVVKAAQKGYRILSSFGVWLVLNQDMKDSHDEDWSHSLEGAFASYFADSDALTNPAVFQAIVRTGYKIGCNVGVFPPDKGKVGLDEYLDQGKPLESLAGVDVAEFVEANLPKVLDALKAENLPKSRAANRAGEIYHAVIRELSRNVPDIAAFKTTYAPTLKKVGYSFHDWMPIYQGARLGRSPVESPRLLSNVSSG